MEDRPVWKTVLSICVTIFLLIRLAMTCSDYNSKKSNYNYNNDLLLNATPYDYNQKIRQEANSQQSNYFLYQNYDQLDSLDANTKQVCKVAKLAKDTLITLDIQTKLSLSKGWYFQKNYDDSLKVAIKTPKNLIVFIHDFDSKQSNEDNLKSIKRGLNPESFTVENSADNSQTISYKITKDGLTFNGYAFCFKQDDYVLYIEFESSRLSKNSLRLEAITFLGRLTKDVDQ